MYTETLQHPHALKTFGPQQPIHDAANIAALSRELAAVDQEYGVVASEVRVAAALNLATTVGQALWYPSVSSDGTKDDYKDMDLPDALPLSALAEKQVADCFGYTLVLSELLDTVNIDHWIGYVNSHATVLLPYKTPRGDNDMYWLDALCKRFNQPVGNALRRATPQTMAEQLSNHGRAVAILDSEELAGNPRSADMQHLSSRYPWLTFNHGKQQLDASYGGFGITDDQVITRHQSKHRLILSAFPAAEGRRMLADYSTFISAVDNDDVQTAFTSLSSLHGVYPEIDARYTDRQVKKLVSRLSSIDPIAALELVERHYDENFALTHDSRIKQRKGDMLRRVAENGRLGIAAVKAITAYNEALASPRAHRMTLLGKLASAQSLLVELNHA